MVKILMQRDHVENAAVSLNGIQNIEKIWTYWRSSNRYVGARAMTRASDIHFRIGQVVRPARFSAQATLNNAMNPKSICDCMWQWNSVRPSSSGVKSTSRVW
jgi:hypothetical protein